MLLNTYVLFIKTAQCESTSAKIVLFWSFSVSRTPHPHPVQVDKACLWTKQCKATQISVTLYCANCLSVSFAIDSLRQKGWLFAVSPAQVRDQAAAHKVPFSKLSYQQRCCVSADSMRPACWVDDTLAWNWGGCLVPVIWLPEGAVSWGNLLCADEAQAQWPFTSVTISEAYQPPIQTIY